MQLVDAHCHLDFDVFDEDRNEVLQRARAVGIVHIVIPGTTRARWHHITALCEQHDGLSACYGLHPYFVTQHDTPHLDALRKHAGGHDCVAIGECGLDFRPSQAPRDVQQQYFEAQLDIARELDKPVVIHAVKATGQVIQTLQRFAGLRGMIHSYSGSYEQAMELIDMGFLLSFGAAAINPRATRLRDTIRRLPLSALLLETDAPDQPGPLHRGQRNQPAWLLDTLSGLAALRGEHSADIAARTTANAVQLFDLTLPASGSD